MKLMPQPKQERFLRSNADIAIFGGAAFLLNIDTPIPTTEGWKVLSDIVNGDRVFDECGVPCTVVEAHPPIVPNIAYRLVFDDGSQIEAGSEHLWLTYDAKELAQLTRKDDEWRARRRAKRPSRASGNRSEAFSNGLALRNSLSAERQRTQPPTGTVRSTQTIHDTLFARDRRANHAIPICKAWSLPTLDLPLDPYLFGVWLGDGGSKSGKIHKPEFEIRQSFIDGGFEASAFYDDGMTFTAYGLVTILKTMGVYDDKHIPQNYLRASIEQRLALLQGLMDTDGSAIPKGNCEFYSSRKHLARQVFELVISLGIKANLRSKPAILYGKECQTAYTVSFSTTLPVFRLGRKARVQIESLADKKQKRTTSSFRYIIGCERIEPMMMRCLTVDSPSHLYLAGKTAIPTHNSGKTFALLMECARYSEYSNFGAVIFRREAKQVNNEGGLRDTALQLYAGLAEYRSQPQSHFVFTSGYRLSLSHLNVESDVISWHGSQIGLLCFDELTTFTAYQFWYMLSRNRSTAGIKPRTLATCNPDPDSWVAEFIDWWIDPESGFPIQERSGKVRYLLRCQNRAGVFGLNWASSRDDLLQSLGFGKPSPVAIQSAKDRMQRAIASGQSPLDGSEEMAYIMERQAIKSVTFVPGNIYDNPIGMMADPGYIANLKAQDPVNRARLLDGNWKIRASAGAYFPDHAARIVETLPDVVCWVRSWDLAATEPSETDPDPDYTVGLLIGRCRDGSVVVADMVRMRKGASFIREMVLATAQRDGPNTLIYIPQDPGQAGKYQITTYREWLAGYTVVSKTVTANKEAMAEPVAALWQSRLISVVRGTWNDALIKELDLFPTGRYDDCVDALTGGVRVLPQMTPDYSHGFNRR